MGFRASLEAVESHIYVTIPVVYKVVSLVRVAMILKWESSRVPESSLSPTVKSWLKELAKRVDSMSLCESRINPVNHFEITISHNFSLKLSNLLEKSKVRTHGSGI